MGIRPAPAAELPEEMVSENWRICLKSADGAEEEDENPEVYAPNKGAECEIRGWAFYLWETGYSVAGRGRCEFDKLEKVGNAYRVRANCELRRSMGKEWHTDLRTENFELELVDGHLVTDLSEG